MDMVSRVQILNEAIWITYSINILGKAMNATILPPAIRKRVKQTELFNLGVEAGLGERNLWIQNVLEMTLCRIVLVETDLANIQKRDKFASETLLQQSNYTNRKNVQI